MAERCFTGIGLFSSAIPGTHILLVETPMLNPSSFMLPCSKYSLDSIYRKLRLILLTLNAFFSLLLVVARFMEGELIEQS